MQNLQQLCVPRASVFDAQRRDTVLDLTDLSSGRIDPTEFFAENYVTEGMRTLLELAFRRLEGRSDQGIFKLRQAMGGGKTHNLLTLGLLARYPEYREQVLDGLLAPDASLGDVKVVAFSGREDPQLGIWGEIAAQLGKRDHFKDCYSPLQAPGQTAWVNLLAGETALILLDELPPYFENARSRAIGNSDLAQVTVTALANLLSAIGKEPCARVCLVLTDLSASYQGGSQRISDVLANFEKETHRSALSLEPVRLNSDELYHILRTRLFERLPDPAEIAEVAQGYARALRESRQMNISSESPEQFAARIQSSYPFHPAIRDLYARFRENEGFQQTRGLIRLMRIMTSRLWNTGLAGQRYLLAAQDLDFNDRETLSEISQINSTLGNAIAKDIAANGAATAEVMDANLGGSDARDAARLLLMSSLANVPNAVIGLSIPEVGAYLCAPGRDLTRLKVEALEKLATAAWYLHGSTDGKLYFKNVQNLNAKLEEYVRNYAPEQALRELRARLDEIFRPTLKWCYQRVLVLPALDDIELSEDQVTLVISEPHPGAGLHPDLRAFYNQAAWKNRMAFLTGPKNAYNQLIDAGKRLRAIQDIIAEYEVEKLPANDPLMKQANSQSDRIMLNFRSAVRENFTQLWYPFDAGLVSVDLRMRVEDNSYKGENQIIETLREKLKFTDEVSEDSFRKKCETRLFTVQSMLWSEIRQRAATNAKWPWHRPDALENLKRECIAKDIWREDGVYVDKGPFPQPKTGVRVTSHRDNETGKTTLTVTPLNGELIYYDYGAAATPASARLEGSTLEPERLRVSFLVVDPTGVHETGVPYTWTGLVTLKHGFSQRGIDKCLVIEAQPAGATIRYTTDGSNPRVAGALYDGPVALRRGVALVQAYAELDGVESEVERIPVAWDKRDDPVRLDVHRPALFKRTHKFDTTRDSYGFIGMLKQHNAAVVGVVLSVTTEGGREYAELNTHKDRRISPEQIEEALQVLRKIQSDGQVQINAEALAFESGQDLYDWAEAARITLGLGEVKQ